MMWLFYVPSLIFSKPILLEIQWVDPSNIEHIANIEMDPRLCGMTDTKNLVNMRLSKSMNFGNNNIAEFLAVEQSIMTYSFCKEIFFHGVR